MEIVTETETGLSFEPEDAVELADVLDRLVGDGVERRRLGAAARAWVERERTLERTGASYRALYERMGVPLGPKVP
jgi:glycosyltransferase involved in cell wall biosynthesis